MGARPAAERQMVGRMKKTLAELSDHELVTRLKSLVRRDAELTAEIVAHLGEVDQRRLYLDEACSSLFVYCTARLGMSESMAYKRIQAARASRRFPVLIDMLRASELHLCGVCLLVPHLTVENHQTLLAAARHKSKREIERLLAVSFPRPNVATTVRRLPEPKREEVNDASTTRDAASGVEPDSDPRASVSENDALQTGSECQGDRPAPSVLPAWRPPPKPSTVLEPLSAARFKVQLTASQTLHDKLRQAQDLLRHQIPDGDIPTILEQALDLLLAEVKRKRFAQPRGRKRSVAARVPSAQDGAGAEHDGRCAKGGAARSRRRSQGTRYVPAEVKRAVVERDGLQCAFVDEQGRRCQETGFLELQHMKPVARGGQSTAANVKLFCRAHNLHAACNDFGVAHVEKRIEEARQGRRPAEGSLRAIGEPAPVQVEPSS
jgi:hypothetical protein